MTIYDSSEEEHDQLISDVNELFQRVEKNIAEYKNVNYAELIKKHDAWISKYNSEQLAQEKEGVQEKIFFFCNPEERPLYFLSERGNLSVDEWHENAHKRYLANGGKDVDATVSSSNVINPELSSDTITNREIGITDTTNKTTTVVESVSDKEEITLVSSTINNESEVVEIAADPAPELSSDSNETPSTIISPSFDNSTSETIDPAEDATDFDVVSSRVNLDDFYSSISNTNHAICTVKATNTKSPFTSFVHTVTSKFNSLWHSLTNSIHSKNESTGDTVSDVNSSSDSSFADNFNKEDGVHCAGEGSLDAGMLSVL